MPLFAKGCYFNSSEDYPYEVETTYQLKYYITSALISIECILEPIDVMASKFENIVQHYRYYVDSLFYFLGLINDRFIYKYNKTDEDLRNKKEERIKLNRNNYQFQDEEFIIICNKMPRNIIEHLDERNVKTMLESSGVGGFNVVFEDRDSNMVAAIKSNRKLYPYNLDLKNKKVLFYNIQARLEEEKEIDIDIFKLQGELKKLEKNVNDFAVFLKR